MKKSAVLFSLFLVLLITLTACGKSMGTIVVDKQGMEHVILTDANGVTVCDKNGNLVEVMTGANKKPIPVPTKNGTTAPGVEFEYQTHMVTFPGLLTDKKDLEDQYCTVSLPDGWENVGNNHMIIENKKTGAQVSIFQNMGSSLEDKLDQLDTDRGLLEGDFNYNGSETTIGGLHAYCQDYEIGEIQRTVYLLMNNQGQVTQITCTVNLAEKDNANFDEVLSAIQFK